VNSRYLMLDGKPWLPVMGEFRYTRYPERYWEEGILKMKAGGVQIVATYVFWIHHEEVEGHFDWSGPRDLHRFVELCGKHGMYVLMEKRQQQQRQQTPAGPFGGSNLGQWVSGLQPK
jgi:beta-galactosidase